MGALKCALVLCDTLWRDPGAAAAADAESSGCEHLAAEDYLRLDSMILVAQLNIRTALDVRAPLLPFSPIQGPGCQGSRVWAELLTMAARPLGVRRRV